MLKIEENPLDEEPPDRIYSFSNDDSLKDACISMIFEKIYIGKKEAASNLVLLKKHKITHILQVCKNVPQFYPDVCHNLPF